jgi:ankyrin repeat protein
MNRKSEPAPDDAALLRLFRAIALGETDKASRLIDASASLVTEALVAGATRQSPTRVPYYEGTTALHVAAKEYQEELARHLITRGANVRARNRRGAEPLHAAVMGIPGSPSWNPAAQKATIECLLEAGADPDAGDDAGVTPLHRAVRNRCAVAVEVLLGAGAQPLGKNDSGSTPLHLAVQSTGRGGTGSAASKEQQRAIIVLLLQHGATPKDRNAQGKTVRQSITSTWIRELLDAQ